MKQRFTEAVAAYDKAIARIAHPGRVGLDRVLRSRRRRGAVASVAEGRGGFRARAGTVARPAVRAELSRLFLADHGPASGRGAADDRGAAERRPNDGAITDSLGWVQFRQGDTQEAVKTLERAVELEPEDATINGHLGDAYWAAGRKIEAQYQWRRALTLNPTPDDAAKLEAKLNTGRTGAVASGP